MGACVSGMKQIFGGAVRVRDTGVILADLESMRDQSWAVRNQALADQATSRNQLRTDVREIIENIGGAPCRDPWCGI